MACSNEDSKAMSDVHEESENSLAEWTIVGDKEPSNSIDEEKETIDESLNTEEAREAIQILGNSTNLETNDIEEDDKNRNEFFVPKDEDSDAISVITDSDKGEETCFNSLAKIILPIDDISPLQIRTLVHIIVACTLATAVGFGIGCFVGTGEPQLSTNDVNFGHSEMMKTAERVDDLNTQPVKPTRREFGAFEKHKINIKITPWEEPAEKKPQTSAKNTTPRNIFEKVQLSLDTLCNFIINNRESKMTNTFCNKRSSLLDLINLKENVQDIILKFVSSKETSDHRFLENIEAKMENISLAFFDDVSKSLTTSMRKIDRKLNKVRRRLNQRVCLIRNTMSDDPKVLEILKKQYKFDENCKIGSLQQPQYKIENAERKAKGKKVDIKKIYPIGPEVHIQGDARQPNENFKKQRKMTDKELIKGKKNYRSQKNSKGDFTSEKELIDSRATKEQLLQPVPIKENIKQSDKRSNVKEVCQSEPCLKHRNEERKNSNKKSNGNWQFKRSEGRNNLRAEKDILDSWEYKRTQARENLRKHF